MHPRHFLRDYPRKLHRVSTRKILMRNINWPFLCEQNKTKQNADSSLSFLDEFLYLVHLMSETFKSSVECV